MKLSTLLLTLLISSTISAQTKFIKGEMKNDPKMEVCRLEYTYYYDDKDSLIDVQLDFLAYDTLNTKGSKEGMVSLFRTTPGKMFKFFFDIGNFNEQTPIDSAELHTTRTIQDRTVELGYSSNHDRIIIIHDKEGNNAYEFAPEEIQNKLLVLWNWCAINNCE